MIAGLGSYINYFKKRCKEHFPKLDEKIIEREIIKGIFEVEEQKRFCLEYPTKNNLVLYLTKEMGANKEESEKQVSDLFYDFDNIARFNGFKIPSEETKVKIAAGFLSVLDDIAIEYHKSINQ